MKNLADALPWLVLTGCWEDLVHILSGLKPRFIQHFEDDKMSRIDTKIRLQLPLTARAEGYLKHRFLLLREDALLEANFMRVPLWSVFILLKVFSRLYKNKNSDGEMSRHGQTIITFMVYALILWLQYCTKQCNKNYKKYFIILVLHSTLDPNITKRMHTKNVFIYTNFLLWLAERTHKFQKYFSCLSQFTSLKQTFGPAGEK